MRFVDRFRFLSGLYEGIVDKTKIHSREGIVSFIETDNGVTVRTDQGNTYEGSILVGADGVHSETRRQLSLASQDEDPKRSKILGNGFITRCKSHFVHSRFRGKSKHVGSFQGQGIRNTCDQGPCCICVSRRQKKTRTSSMPVVPLDPGPGERRGSELPPSSHSPKTVSIKIC